MRTQTLPALVTVIVALGAVTPARAQTSAGNVDDRITADSTALGARAAFRIERGSGIKVDGDLSDGAWREAARVPLPYETDPGDNTPARVETECYLAFDDANLYFGCHARDHDASAIRAFVTDRDNAGTHDLVGITIDPFNDARRAFRFAVNPLGVQQDARFDQEGGWDDSWDAIWRSAGRITNDGYVVEAAIPFKSLRFPAGQTVQTWGFYARRLWPRSEQVELRSMRWDRDNSCALCQANLLVGIEGVSPGRNLEFTPTLTGARTDSRDDIRTGSIERGPFDREVGFDARWGITPNLTLQATVNPDFSQVEADVAQLDVNNRFALFFPEKRPFFLEGADFFSTPIRAVFTRSIADPVVGAKVTGKMGANAVGVMTAQDNVNNLIFPGSQGSSSTTVEDEVTTAVARYRRDLGSSNTIGVLYAGREGGDYHNRVAGADAFFRPWQRVTMRAQYLHSQTRYPDQVARDNGQPLGTFAGHGARLNAQYSTRNWSNNLSIRALSSDLRADAGFLTQVDVLGADMWVSRRFWGNENSWYTRYGVEGGAWHNEALDGTLIGNGVWANVFLEGPAQSSFWINPNLRRQHFGGQTFRLVQLWAGGGFRPSGNVGVDVWGMVGNEIDFSNVQRGFNIRLNPSLSLRLGRHIDLQLNHTLQRLTKDGREIFTANIAQARAVYNFSPRVFVRAIVQYRHTDRNPEAYQAEVQPNRQSVFTQFLFSYKVNPQTAVFLGYSDNRVAFTDAQLERVPLTQMNRSLFLKLGYAWRP